MTHNPEMHVWRGRSYRKGGERVRDLRHAAWVESWRGTSLEEAAAAREPLPENKLSRDRFERVEREIMYFDPESAALPEWTNCECFSTIAVWDRDLFLRTGFFLAPRAGTGMQMTVVEPFGTVPLYGYCW